ncbi:ribonucleoside-diphosphate reductase subunit alpha, partial [Akkermansiaceae bacterium]|nr:ribonucleoside-diphosphate reductase subunit alpha [Akkermansiaceae bacterium]
MYRSITLEEDLALKETVSSRHADASTVPYAWRETLTSEHRAPVPEITITRAGAEETFSLSNVADAIGESLTNLLISRKEPEDAIFSDKNRSFVSAVAHSVSKRLMNQVQRGGQLK